jgi:hypothetical protein
MTVKRSPPAPPPKIATHQARGRQQRQLRIIAGRWRGKRFRFPELDIRPTPDRVRETLFNWLQTRIEGAHCLDLYAGSGALGLEALSRGAASVVFVEHQRAAVNALRALLRDWQASGATVVCDEAQHYLAAAAVPTRRPPMRAAASIWSFSIRRMRQANCRRRRRHGARRSGARRPHLRRAARRR